jgi:hypothetical protein
MAKKRTSDRCVTDYERLLADMQSADVAVRAKAVHSTCPCTNGWGGFEKLMDIVAKLKKDPSPAVRAIALHVFQDAAETQSSGLQTHRAEVTNEFLRTRRRHRFAREDDESLRYQPEKVLRCRSRKS